MFEELVNKESQGKNYTLILWHFGLELLESMSKIQDIVSLIVILDKSVMIKYEHIILGQMFVAVYSCKCNL